MQGPITWDAVQYFVSMLVAVLAAGGVLWRTIAARTAYVEKELISRIQRIEQELVAFKMDVLKNYVQHPNMEQVEKRLIDAIEKLTSKIEGLQSILMRQVSPSRSRRGSNEG